MLNFNFTTYFTNFNNFFIPMTNQFGWQMPTLWNADAYTSPTDWKPTLFDYSQFMNSGDSFTRCSTKTDKSTFAKYNRTAGEKLSSYIKSHAKGFKQTCAKSVSDALATTHLSNGKRGNAWQMKEILRNNSHFQEIPVKEVKDTTSLPKGTILVYDKGACGYSKEYGHVEVAIGNGKAASDGIHEIKGMPSALFIPI